MEMHQVRYFLAVVSTLNFTRAAERCNVSPPSLIKAIKLLEADLGGPLFRRERARTHLTELGHIVLPYLEQIVASADRAKTETARAQVAELHAEYRHYVHFGAATVSESDRKIPRAMATSESRHHRR